MIAWFSWKNSRSNAMGLWVTALPPIIRPEERTEKIEIPGRAGSLTMLQGEDIYKSYVKECQVTCRRDIDIQNVLNWLRGSGVVVFGNEPHKAYNANISSAVRFEKISNDLMQATIPFYVEPFKRSLNPLNDRIIISEDSATIKNGCDIASRPKITIAVESGTSNVSISIASATMSFANVSGTIIVDCGAEIVTQNGAVWTGTFTGDFLRIPVGDSAFTKTGNATITIDPEWGWV